MKNVLVICVFLISLLSVLNAEDFNSTSVEMQERILELISNHKAYKLEKYKHNSLWKKKKFILRAMKESGLALEYASDTLKANKAFVLSVVDIDGYALKYADNRLKNDREVVLRAVKNYGYILSLLDNKFKDDKEIVLEALSNESVLGSVSARLQDDKDVVLKSVSHDGRTLDCASQRLRDDKKIVLAALTNNKYAIAYVSKRLRNDKEVVNLALGTFRIMDANMKYIGKTLKNDKEYMAKIIKNYGFALGYVGVMLRNDEDLALIAMKWSLNSLQDVHNKYKKDKRLILMLLEQQRDTYSEFLMYIDETLKKDKAFIYKVLSMTHYGLEYVDASLKDDEAFLLKFLNDDIYLSQSILRRASKRLRKNKHFVLKVLHKKGMRELGFVDDSLKNDKDFILSLPRDIGSPLNHIGKKLLNDKNFVLKLSQKYNENKDK